MNPAWCRGAVAVLVCLVFSGNSASDDKAFGLPGAAPFPEELQQRLERAAADSTAPRTRHVRADGRPRYTNRLILEPSPYLRQHAHNPVNWYAWGDEAFARATRENKPVLLSIGYATCHWCHVMARESFEDVEVAAYLNRHYVAVKVDREQRPDVDGLYMAAVHMLSGRRGWPLTVWLTPDREPFSGGTYFPPRDDMRGHAEGLLGLLARLRAVYHETPDEVASVTRRLTDALPAALAPDPTDGDAEALPRSGDLAETFGPVLARGAQAFMAEFDATHGGFGGAPKFPRSVVLEFLMRYARRTNDAAARAAVIETLTAMAAGGLHDQIGGGFHRYATDRAWRVPHFEKMLYDNALLAAAYLEGFQFSRRPEFARVARDTLDYLDREMSAPGGGFFSAIDAESGGEEGGSYVWRTDQLDALLSPSQSRLLRSYYGFPDDPRAHVPYVARPLAEVAEASKPNVAEADRELQAARARLKRARDRRPAPQTDAKVLAAWNGLAISAFAKAAHVLNEPAYAERAARAARFVLERMQHDGRLRRSALGETTTGDAYLDDYALLIAGLLDLYEADFDPGWLDRAIALQAVLDAHFWDEARGGYFLGADDTEQLLAREKPAYDGALPSGNAVAAGNLLRLAEFTTRSAYRTRAEACFATFAAQLRGRPASLPRLLSALDFALDRPKEIAIVKAASHDDVEPFLARLRGAFLPNRVLAVVTQGEDSAAHQRRIPWLEAKIAIGGRVTAYVCERHVCKLPTGDPDTFARQIAR